MRTILGLWLAAALAGCAGFDGRGLVAGQSTEAEVDRLMGSAAEKRKRPDGETWAYYPRQPFGRKVFVARFGPDGRLRAVEQRLTDENVAKVILNTTRAEQVRDLFGPPYYVAQFPRMDRNTWSWHMRRYGDTGMPAGLHVQMSPDGIVREVYMLDEGGGNDADRANR